MSDIWGELTRELRASDDPNPRDAAASLFARVPRSQRDQWLLELLEKRALDVASQLRANSLTRAQPASWRNQQIRDGYWTALLRERVFMPDGTWKFLGDCTADDLRMVATQRRVEADRLLAQAEHFEAIVVEMENSGVTTVAELREPVLI